MFAISDFTWNETFRLILGLPDDVKHEICCDMPQEAFFGVDPGVKTLSPE